MFSSRKFMLIFFVLTTLLAMGSAMDLRFWARQNNNDQPDGGKNNNIGSDAPAQASSGDTSGSTTSDTGTTTDPGTTSPTSTPPTSTPTSTPPTSTPTSTPSSTPSTDAGSTSTIPNTTPGASATQVIVVQTSVISGSSVPVTHTKPAGSAATNDLAQQSNSGSSGGVPEQTKKVAIGVGVGVGGAILLGALAVVGWRMWGRKKHNGEEDPFLMNEPVAEKPMSPGSTASPFKSTLDQYHNPAGRLNTASNF